MILQWSRSPGKKGSHFHPDSDLFVPNERKGIVTSTACWTAMAALLVCLNFVMGPVQMLKLYGIPYWVGLILQCLIKPLWILFVLMSLHWKCRFLSCGWTLWPICITMAMRTNFPGTAERSEDNLSVLSWSKFFLQSIWFSFIVLANQQQEWSYLRGGLTTLDRDYGWINNIHHDIGTHVIHHLFPQIPHYHLIEAVSIIFFL